MKRTYLILFIGSILFLGSCGKRVEKPGDDPVKTEFGPAVNDKDVKLDGASPLKITKIDANQEITFWSADWLGLSEELFETAQYVDSDLSERMNAMAHRISQEYYRFGDAATQMTAITKPAGNPYTELAFSYAQPALVDKLNQVYGDLGKDVDRATEIIPSAAFDHDAFPNSLEVIQSVIKGLSNFKTQLKKVSSADNAEAVDEVNNRLDTHYLLQLNDLKVSATRTSGITAEKYLLNLQTALGKFTELSDLQRKKILKSVDRGLNILHRVDAIKNTDDMFAMLIDLWLGHFQRSEFPDKLAKIFSSSGDDELLALATNNTGIALSDDAWQKLKMRKNNVPYTDRELIALTTGNVKKLVPDDAWFKLKNSKLLEIQKLLNQDDVKLAASLLAHGGTNSSGDMMITLVVNWLSLSARVAMPAELASVFKNFPEATLVKMKEHSTLGLLSQFEARAGFKHFLILWGLGSYQAGAPVSPKDPVGQFKWTMTEAMFASAQDAVNDTLIPIANDLPAQIRSALHRNIDEKKSTVQKDAGDRFHQLARYYMGKIIFGEESLVKDQGGENHEFDDNFKLAKKTLPLLEKNRLRVAYNGKQWVSFPVPEQTGAEILGLGFSNFYYRINGIENFEDTIVNSQIGLSLMFQPIAKLSILMGYSGYDLQPVDNLAVRLSPGSDSKKFDIRNYDPIQTTFAAPDVMQIQAKDHFKLDMLAQTNFHASVDSQMELMRGYVNMLKFLKPWVNSPFDLGLSKVRIDEESTIEVFPKEKLFEMCLGMAAQIGLNMKSKMAGLVTEKDELIPASKFPDDISQVQARGAVVTDMGRDVESQIVTSQGIAKALIAFSEFYETMSDFAQSRDPIVIDALPRIEDSKPLIKKLLVGMSVFASTHLMNSDGGVVQSYNFGNHHKFDGPRRLEDQLIMEQALLTAGRVIDSDVIRYRALDNLFFLDNHMWDEQAGFYQNVEKGTNHKVKLISVVRAIKNIELLRRMTQSPNVEDALVRLDRLEKFWASRFLSPSVSKLHPVYQVLEFSL